MSGNVWEWCYDWHEYAITIETDIETDPLGPSSGSFRVQRGGNWRGTSHEAAVFVRNSRGPSIGDSTIGFRVVRPSSK